MRKLIAVVALLGASCGPSDTRALITAAENGDLGGVQFAEKACTLGSAVGCNNLGTHYDGGVGVARDKARARSLFKQACDGGIEQGCLNLKTP